MVLVHDPSDGTGSFSRHGVEQAVVSPAAILLSENVRCWISVCRGNPTRFDVHVLTLGGDIFRRWRSRVAKQMFYDTLKPEPAPSSAW